MAQQLEFTWTMWFEKWFNAYIFVLQGMIREQLCSTCLAKLAAEIWYELWFLWYFLNSCSQFSVKEGCNDFMLIKFDWVNIHLVPQSDNLCYRPESLWMH